MLDQTRINWNKKHNILIAGKEVEIYFQHYTEPHEAGAHTHRTGIQASRRMRHGGYHAIPGTGGPGMPPPSIPDIMSRRRNSRVRRNDMMYAHGGMMRNGECAPGEMCHGGYHNGMRRGGPVRRRYAHGGYHSNGNGINAGSPSSCIDGMGRNVPC